MKKKTTIKEIKIEPQPFFKKGSLAYEKSGHELELSGRHYRCRKHCKSESGEKQIKKENLEKNFSYFSQKFRVEQKVIAEMGNKLLNQYLVSMLTNFEGTEGKQEILDNTIRAMNEDAKNIKSVKAEKEYFKTGKYKKGGKIKKEDIKTFEDTFVAKQKQLLPDQLFMVLLSYLKTLSDPRYAKHLGMSFGIISKKVYISNDGKILKIELERWGWYILNYINRSVPNYLNNLKKQGVIIVNGYDEINEMDIEEAVRYFDDLNFSEALNWLDVDSLYSLFGAMRGVIKSLQGGPEETQEATLELFDFMNTNPFAQLATQLLPAVSKGLKIKKSAKKK